MINIFIRLSFGVYVKKTKNFIAQYNYDLDLGESIEELLNSFLIHSNITHARLYLYSNVSNTDYPFAQFKKIKLKNTGNKWLADTIKI